APDAIDTITEIIDESLIKVRDMLRNLSPSILYELGLVPALQDYIDGTQELTDIEILFEQQGNRVHLEEPLRVAMFQAICELITNSVKHAGCNHIWVTLDWSEADLARVTVADDGGQGAWWQHLETGTDAPFHLGLLAARERLQRYDRVIVHETRPGGGTLTAIRTTEKTEKGVANA
ncbi:MAG: ATP-binding protein, partial [Pseudomonadota bacterium]